MGGDGVTLSERLRDISKKLDSIDAYPGRDAVLLDRTVDSLDAVVAELEGKVAVTPSTVELDPGVWVTRFPHVEVHGSSPEDSLASFVERVEEAERAKA